MEGPPHETPQSRTLSELNAFVNRFAVARTEPGLQRYGQRQSRADQQADEFGHLAIGETRHQPRHERSVEALPGIGSTYSQKIIDGRPYHSKRDLLTRKIVPQKTYDGIQDKIIAHRATGAKTKTKSSTGTPPKPQ